MMPGMSGFNDMYKQMQRQTDALADMPKAVADIQRAVRSAADTIDASKDTVASAQRSTARVEAVIDELEEPVRSLKASIERLNAVLGDPVVERIPATIQRIEDAVLPYADALDAVRARAARLRARIRGIGSTARNRLRTARD